MIGDDYILFEQIQYYRERANEYDDWFLRLGRYDRGADANRRWFEEVQEVRQVIRGLPLDGKNVLELAPGTGIWTRELCLRVARLTAVDASPEMIALNRERLGSDASRVTFIEADVFDWRPREVYDAIIFCFWISHVPGARLDNFLTSVATMLEPGGTVFFLDGRREHTSTAVDHVLPQADHEIMIRRLDDGREFSIVKNFWNAEVLAEKCHHAGLDVTLYETATYFQFGVGMRSPTA